MISDLQPRPAKRRKAYYILTTNHDIAEAPLHTWADWLSKNTERCTLKKTELATGKIYTKFTGLDTGIIGEPVELFRTTSVMDGRTNESPPQYRHWDTATYADAIRQHDEIVRRYSLGY